MGEAWDSRWFGQVMGMNGNGFVRRGYEGRTEGEESRADHQ